MSFWREVWIALTGRQEEDRLEHMAAGMQKAIHRAQKLHKPCAVQGEPYCGECRSPWPCSTTEILQGW